MFTCFGFVQLKSYDLIKETKKLFEWLTEVITGLNQYQVRSLKFTSNLSRLSYEAIPWLVLESLLVAGFIPEMKDTAAQVAVIISISTTVLMIINIVAENIWISGQMQESFVMHIMGKMTACSSWIPYQL